MVDQNGAAKPAAKMVGPPIRISLRREHSTCFVQYIYSFSLRYTSRYIHVSGISGTLEYMEYGIWNMEYTSYRTQYLVRGMVHKLILVSWYTCGIPRMVCMVSWYIWYPTVYPILYPISWYTCITCGYTGTVYLVPGTPGIYCRLSTYSYIVPGYCTH